MFVLGVADDGLDGGTPSHFTLDLWSDRALLLGCIDLELVIGWRVVVARPRVGMKARDGVADEMLDFRNDRCQRVAIIRVAGQRLCVDDELAALGVLEGRVEADLDAELIGLLWFSLTDSFDLRGVQAVDLGAGLAAVPVHAPVWPG